MYLVLEVAGITALEALVLVLFVSLFAWIAFSFLSTLAGFFVLLAGTPSWLNLRAACSFIVCRHSNGAAVSYPQ